MKDETKKLVQILLLVALVASSARLALIFYNRHASVREEKKDNEAARLKLDPDYFVVPRKLHAYDLASARELQQHPVWVRDGYRYPCFPYAPARRHADFSRQAGLLAPLEKIEIKDLIKDRVPDSNSQPVMAAFEKDGKWFAFEIGVIQAGETQIFSDEMLLLDDPRQLYRHWPAHVWDRVMRHEVTAGMSELQATFSIGMGIPQPGSTSTYRTVRFANNGKPVTVKFVDGKATEVTPEVP